MSAQKVQQIIGDYIGKKVETMQSLEIGLGLSLSEVYDIAVDLEDEFGVMIDDNTAASWVTVQDVINFVNSRAPAKVK